MSISIINGNLIVSFSEEYSIGYNRDNSLLIIFEEETFHIKEEEEFVYRKAIASSNGDITLEAINLPEIELIVGHYLMKYTICDKEESSKSRTYLKLLTASKNLIRL